MTTLYRPVKITSAEQAEALPIGTVAVSPADDLGDAQACIRVEGGWHVTREVENNDQDTIEHALMIGDQAFVPIEAEEEFSTIEAITRWGATEAIYDSRENLRRDGWSDPIHIRLTTRLILDEDA